MRDRVIDWLAQFPLIHGCTPSERRAIARVADHVRVKAGEVVSCAHEGRNPVVMVARGEVVVMTAGGVTRARAGSVVGATAVLAGRPRTGQVVTATDAELFLIEPRCLLPLLERCPNLAIALLRSLARASNA